MGAEGIERPDLHLQSRVFFARAQVKKYLRHGRHRRHGRNRIL